MVRPRSRSTLHRGSMQQHLHQKKLTNPRIATVAADAIERQPRTEEVFRRRGMGARVIDRIRKQRVRALTALHPQVIEGYKDAAEKFARESGAQPSVDLQSISERMATRVAIQNGDVQAAIERANDLNPLILDENPALFFHLQQQKLIELIRADDVAAALRFAEAELAPRGEENPAFLAELERTMALLAFEDASKSPVAHLLDPAQRQKTASELNAAILTSQCQDKDPKLPAMLKLLIWAQEQLKEHADFPEMDVRKAVLQPPPESL